VSADEPEQLEGLRRAGRVVAELLRVLRRAVQPGVRTGDLDAIAAEGMAARGARSGPILTYQYPGHICVSVGDEVVHAIPGERRLNAGEIVTLDVAAELDGYHADAAITVPVGAVSPEATRLMAVTRLALAAGMRAAQPGASLRDIGLAVESTTRAGGFCVFRDLTGHGIGLGMHEEPTVFNWPAPGSDQILTPGMVFTIEPMIGAGSPRLRVGADGWTVRTADRSLSAHEEHTIMVAEHGPVILTAGL
jgi:methionyl aminopeptidase